MKRDVPEPWASAMREAGVVDKRWGNPSWSELGRRVGVHASTLTAMADGTRATNLETIAAVAKELRVKDEVIRDWLDRPASIGDLYDPPEESRLLSDGERLALTGLIKAMAAEKEGTGHVATPAEKKEDEVARRRAERERAGGKKRAARSRESDDPPKK